MPSPRTKTSLPKLSEVAKHLVLPEGAVSTGWPAVRDKCQELGVTFDPWQNGLGAATLAKRDNGVYAAAIGGVTWSIPRQVGKTFLVGHMIFALCMLNPGMTVLWTAHRSRTSDETFEDMIGMSRKPRITPHMLDPTRGAGTQSIRFKNRSRVMFGAREQGFGRGFTNVSIAVFDEAQILTDRAIDDMVPATNSVENALVIKVGTPPKPVDASEIFTEARRAALSGQSKDALYVEMGADEGASADDWKQIAKANPSYPHRTSKTAILRLKSNLTEESFIREGLGVWDSDEVHTQAIDLKRWANLRVSEDTRPQEGRTAYAVKFSPDGSKVALAAAKKPPGSVAHVEPIRQEPMGLGIDWLVEWLSERSSTAAQIVVDGNSGSGALIAELRAAGVKNPQLITTPSLDQIKAAHSMFDMAVKSGSISHTAQPALDDQIASATRRVLSKRDGGFAWAPSGDGTTVMFDAATFAYWSVMTTKRNPGGGTRRGRSVAGRGRSVVGAGRSVRR